MKTQSILFLLSLIFVQCNLSTDRPMGEIQAVEVMGSEVEYTEEVESVHQVVIQGMEFIPQYLKVNAGDKVVWINKDIVTHNVTDDLDRVWTSGDILVGNSWGMVIKNDVQYVCTLHPTMKGAVEIK